MEKDALLEIIIHDLKEVELLAQNVKGDNHLSKAYFKLTRNRINSILEEIEMLEEISLPPDDLPEKTNRSTDTQEFPVAEQENPVVQKENKISPTISTPDNLPKEVPSEELLPRHNEPELKKEKPEDKPATEETVSKELTETPAPNTVEAPASENVTPKKLKAEIKEERNKENKVLGEKLVQEKSSFNEQIGKNQKKEPTRRSYSAPPIADLKKAMGINDRFFFQRELFGGSAEVMNQTLDQLNQMRGINEAHNFLLANFNWDPENEAVLSFMELVERRYL